MNNYRWISRLNSLCKKIVRYIPNENPGVCFVPNSIDCGPHEPKSNQKKKLAQNIGTWSSSEIPHWDRTLVTITVMEIPIDRNDSRSCFITEVALIITDWLTGSTGVCATEFWGFIMLGLRSHIMNGRSDGTCEEFQVGSTLLLPLLVLEFVRSWGGPLKPHIRAARVPRVKIPQKMPISFSIVTNKFRFSGNISVTTATILITLRVADIRTNHGDKSYSNHFALEVHFTLHTSADSRHRIVTVTLVDENILALSPVLQELPR